MEITKPESKPKFKKRFKFVGYIGNGINFDGDGAVVLIVYKKRRCGNIDWDVKLNIEAIDLIPKKSILEIIKKGGKMIWNKIGSTRIRKILSSIFLTF